MQGEKKESKPAPKTVRIKPTVIISTIYSLSSHCGPVSYADAYPRPGMHPTVNTEFPTVLADNECGNVQADTLAVHSLECLRGAIVYVFNHFLRHALAGIGNYKFHRCRSTLQRKRNLSLCCVFSGV